MILITQTVYFLHNIHDKHLETNEGYMINKIFNLYSNLTAKQYAVLKFFILISIFCFFYNILIFFKNDICKHIIAFTVIYFIIILPLFLSNYIIWIILGSELYSISFSVTIMAMSIFIFFREHRHP